MPISSGDILDGRYLIKDMIAEGGMGTVYSGLHVKLGRNIAIKILKAKHIEDEEQRARFMQEARAAAELHHRNIVDVIDIGTSPDGAPYFVMELLVGESLRDRMKNHLPMQPREIGSIIKQTLAGLGAAHFRGIIHRDIKPSNIFISREIDGRELVKILDFGISKLQKLLEEEEADELTEDGTVLGTPLYMSPEQAAGKRELVNHTTDLYACGVILYKALTGHHPYKGRNYNEIMHSIFTTEPTPPSKINPQVSVEMERVIMKAMAKNQQDRYSSAEEFLKDIGVFMVEVTQTGLVLPVSKQFGSQTPTPSSLKPMIEENVAVKETKSPEPLIKISTPVSAPSLAGRGAWEEVGGIMEGEDALQKKSLFPWLLIMPFAVTLLIVGGILLIVAGKYIGKAKTVKDENYSKPGHIISKGEETGIGGHFGDVGGVKRTPDGKKEKVKITFTDLPKGSMVFINNILKEENPVEIEKSVHPIKIRIEAEGFTTFETEVVPGDNIVIPVTMKLLPQEEKFPAGKKKKKRRGKKHLDLLTDFPE